VTSYGILSEVHSKQSIQVDLSPNFKVLMKDLYISYRRKKAAKVIWRSYLIFHIVLNVMHCPYVFLIVYWSPANYTCLLLGSVGLKKPVLLVLKTHLLTVSALMLVNFQQKKKQTYSLLTVNNTFLAHKWNAQQATPLPNHGGINIARDVQNLLLKVP
jgi:hypothetical protein